MNYTVSLMFEREEFDTEALMRGECSLEISDSVEFTHYLDYDEILMTTPEIKPKLGRETHQIEQPNTVTPQNVFVLSKAITQFEVSDKEVLINEFIEVKEHIRYGDFNLYSNKQQVLTPNSF